MTKSSYVPDGDEIARHVPWARLEKDAHDNVIGVYPEAFRLRDGEPYLSTAWLDFFTGSKRDKLKQTHTEMSKSRTLGKKSGFAVAGVKPLKDTCSTRNAKLRVIHEPKPDFKNYVAVRRFPSDDEELLEILAAECWAELHLVRDII